MEILNMHAQFEELAAEMKKLSGAAALVDRTARNSDAVVKRGGDLVETASLLLTQAQATVGQATEKLEAAAASLEVMRTELDANHERQALQAKASTERIEASIREAASVHGEQQDKAAGLVRDAITQTDGHVQLSAERVIEAVSGALVQQGKKLDETNAQAMAAGQVGRKALADFVAKRIDTVNAALVEHGKAIRSDIEDAKVEREAAARWVMRLLIVVIVLQVAALSISLLT